MKKNFLIKMVSVVFVLGLFNSAHILAKAEQVAQQNEQQQLSEKEKKEKNIETIKEYLKKLQDLENTMQKNLLNMFKNFKKENYEVDNYSLEVFKKNNAPILVYTHKKTGAQVYFNLVLDKEKLKQREDELVFRAPSKNDKGLVHFGEHCLLSPIANYLMKKLKINYNDLNAKTDLQGLNFISAVGVFGLNEKLEKEYVEKLSKELINPSVFEKDNKIFEVEKRRILNEMKDKSGTNYENLDSSKSFLIREFKAGGEIPELEKVSLKDFKNFYKKYIHPSNCLLIKNVAELNSSKIKKYLNMWHENYFKHFEKKEMKDVKYEEKIKQKYLFKSWPKDSENFLAYDHEKNKEQKFNYFANFRFDTEKFTKKQLDVLEVSLEVFKEELDKFIKDLGYENHLRIGPFMGLLGNKKELFKKEVLEENSKKIFNFVANKLKNLSEEDLFYSINYKKGYHSFNKSKIEKRNLKNTDLWSDPEKYQNDFMYYLVKWSFLETGKPISQEYFLINNNELESSHELQNKYIKENLNENSNIYFKFAKQGPKYINVYEKSDKTLKQMYEQQIEKYKKQERVLPIKLKDENSNKFVRDFAYFLFVKALDDELNRNQGLVYVGLYCLNAIENNFVGKFELNKDSVKDLEEYIFENFKKIMKNINIKEEELNELKKQYKEKFNSFKIEYESYFKSEVKIIKDIENYIKTGKIDKNSVLYSSEDLKITDFLRFYPKYLETSLDFEFFTFYKDYKDYKFLFILKIFFLCFC